MIKNKYFMRKNEPFSPEWFVAACRNQVRLNFLEYFEKMWKFNFRKNEVNIEEKTKILIHNKLFSYRDTLGVIII
jgi:hypothetical protein